MLSALREFIKKTPLFSVLRPISNLFIPAPPSDPFRWETVRQYGKKFQHPCLIETGTYLGGTVQAVKDDFERIYSIELGEKLAKDAQERFKAYPHITIIQGDSGKVLPGLLPTIQQPVVFWLDAHFSEGVTAKGEKIAPIMEELASIFKHTAKDFVVLIDDAREFGWYQIVVRGRKDFPTIRTLREFITKLNPAYKVKVADGIIRISK